MSGRWRFDLAFEGSGFTGWQEQPGRRTVQGEIARALERLGEGARPVGAGRTDAGVHALHMVVHVDLDRTWAREELVRALRAEFPRDILVRELRPVEGSFHARFDARERTYHYALALADNPFFRFRRWSVPVLPSLGWIRGELEALRENRDFAALSRSGGGGGDTQCRILAAEWQPMPGGALLRVTADRFLHGMVRTLVGTLVGTFARGAPRGHLASVLQGGCRTAAGKAAPPQGLYLTGVRYADERGRPDAGDHVAALAGLGGGEVWA